MSFRTRLTLFFVLIVIVPMISVTLVLFRLISDNESAKSDAPLATRVEAVANLYNLGVLRSDAVLRRIAADRGLATALARRDGQILTRRAVRLSGVYGAARLVILRDRRVVVDVGDHTAVSPAARDLRGADGRALGQMEVSSLTARDYIEQARSIVADPRGRTHFEVAIGRRGRLVQASIPGVSAAVLGRLGRTRIAGRDYRVASVDLPGFRGIPLRISVLTDLRATSGNVASAQRLAGAILAGFFLLAFACAVLVSRSLQQQIARFLQAARSLGGGDFGSRVPVDGRDEFAALGNEFNKMSDQLAARLEELRQQRTRLEGSLRRIGETFASNLDREALLRIVLSTAVDGVDAQVGRGTSRREPGAPLEERARVGDLEGLEDLLTQTEQEVEKAAAPREMAAGGAFALGHPLLAEGEDRDGRGKVLGTICVARRREFSRPERELFHYLAGQAAISIENVQLHETVQRQAVTDELTGLYNHRRFQEALAQEVERSKRFDQDMGLVMIDIDNFKRVNDTYGHQQGDLVLREVARTLREYSREIDSPARYGGEELAVVLPQTDLEGTYNLAERVRTGIEQLELPLLDGSGTMSVTASLGVAALPGSGSEPHELVAVADAALYEAKHSGKNRTVRAQ
ncbi:MAG TPA: diguanylate cyclase [Solirubrobacteraceae bacterium]|jgi:diguanylate cyclase (GGDEF)-like protein|nr:diguanylate cyclase [Solirubrobacteraceae bacterium]